MRIAKKIDATLFFSTVTLVVAGIFIFTSASMGILVREGISFSTIAIKQIAIGIVGGGIVLIFGANLHYKSWRSYALPIFIASIVASLLVFVPYLGFSHGGATRWIALGPITFQPSEIMKLGAVIYLAAWFSSSKNKADSFKTGFLPFIVVLGVCEGIFLLQHDTDLVIVAALFAIYIVAGAKWRHVLLCVLLAICALFVLISARPYLKDRVLTFLNPGADAQGSGYQIQQSLIAIGTGGIFGRGFGQSIQKFNFLPEPIGDSIFAVAGEEFGLLGLVILISLFTFFALRGFGIAAHIKDPFGRLLAVGIVTLIISQAFINMGAMAGILPLTGVPLTFVSQGGTAILFALFEVGIVLNISRERA